MDVVLSQALFIEFIHSDFSNHTYTHVPNMGRKENAASPRTKKAASLLIKCPALTTSEAMKAADFSTKESNDRTIQRRVQRRKLTEAQSDKKKRKVLEKRENEAKEVLAQNKEINMLNGGELKKILTWHQVPAKDMGSVEERRTRLTKIVDEKKKAPDYSKWTEDDETELVALKATNFDLKETQLGRLEAARKKECEGSIMRMPMENRLQYIEMLKDMPNNGETTPEV